MSIDQELLSHYCQRLSSQNDSVLLDLERDISLYSSDPSLSSDYIQGRFLSFISKLIKPKRILEIGTFWGYSTLSLSEGLDPDGIIHTIEKNVEYVDRINSQLEKAKISSKVKVFNGPALQILKSLDINTYDLFFVDAAKKEYTLYYEQIVSKAKRNSIVIFDNVLWKGAVIENEIKGIAKSMKELNERIKNDNRVQNFILPLRDGLNIITIS